MRRKKHAVQTLAEDWLVKHGLTDWTIQDATPKRIGTCWTKWIEGLTCYDKRIIFLRLDRLARASIAYQIAVIRHEVSHALVGRYHDIAWADCMMRLGATGEDVLFDLHHAMHQADAADRKRACSAFEDYASNIGRLAKFLSGLRAGTMDTHPSKHEKADDL